MEAVAACLSLNLLKVAHRKRRLTVVPHASTARAEACQRAAPGFDTAKVWSDPGKGALQQQSLGPVKTRRGTGRVRPRSPGRDTILKCPRASQVLKAGRDRVEGTRGGGSQQCCQKSRHKGAQTQWCARGGNHWVCTLNTFEYLGLPTRMHCKYWCISMNIGDN